MDGSGGGFGVTAAPLEVLEDEITTLAAHLAAATFRLLTLIAEFDRRDGWVGYGMRSCAHWLNWRCGLDLGAAREKLRVAHALSALPLISAAFERGEVSYSKVRAMTRVATAANEAELLNVAQCGTALHVERLVRGYRRMKRLEDANREHAERYVSWHEDEDGCLVIRGRIPAEIGALVRKGLEAAVQSVREQEVAAEAAPPGQEHAAAARRADALVLLAETFLAQGPGELAGGERHQVVVHVSAETLREGNTDVAMMASEPGTDAVNVSAETCRRIGCDCSLVHVTEDEQGEPLNVGRKTRSIPPAIMRALRLRDRGCRFPGCSCRHFVDGHHIRHWADGGETKLSNLVLLCRFHHRLVHEGGFSVQLGDGSRLTPLLQAFGSAPAIVFRRPDGTRVADAGAVAPLLASATADLATTHARRGLVIGADTLVPDWHGEEMDDEIAVAALIRADARAGHVSAETSRAVN